MLCVASEQLENPGAKLGRVNGTVPPARPKREPEFESTTSMGRPDITTAIPLTFQFESSNRVARECSKKAGCGRFHKELSTRRCVRSKSDKPRLLRASS